MVRRTVLLLLAPALACGSFGAEAADADGGTSGAVPGTFCSTLPDVGFCEDFDTGTTLRPLWVKSSAQGCDIAIDSNANSAPRALHVSCTDIASSNHITLSKLGFGRTMKVRFALFVGPRTAPSATLLSYASEGRTFALKATDAGFVAEADLGATPAVKSFPFAKAQPTGTWTQVKIEVYYDDKDGHVFVDVDDNRVVDASGLFTYPHGQIPPANALLLGAESMTPGGTVDVAFDDIVIDPATLPR